MRVLFVTWDGGGNVNPLLALGPRLAARGWEVHTYGPPSLAARFAASGTAYVARDVPDPWDATAMAADVRDQIVRIGADVVLVDYMLPGALCGAEAAGRPTAALVHTLYRALLVDGAPGPIAMAASVDGVNAARRSLGLDDITGFGDLLDRCSRVLVTCPADLDPPPPDAAANAVADPAVAAAVDAVAAPPVGAGAEAGSGLAAATAAVDAGAVGVGAETGSGLAAAAAAADADAAPAVGVGAETGTGLDAAIATVDAGAAGVGAGAGAGSGRDAAAAADAGVLPDGAGAPGAGAAAGNVRYVGALLEPAGDDAGWAPPTVGGGPGGRRRVVVSLGTTPMDEAPVLRRVLAALADLPVDVVATVGDHLDAGEVAAAAPDNVTVTGYVCHAALLPDAGLLVTHAGLGTVLAGLAHGVPLVCLPLGREQPANAAAVARLGAGRVLPPGTPVDDLRIALADVLDTPAYRTAAAALAATMADRTGLAESELEALLPAGAEPGI